MLHAAQQVKNYVYVGLRGSTRVDRPIGESEAFSTSERRVQGLLRQVVFTLIILKFSKIIKL